MLIVLVAWVADIMILGPPVLVKKATATLDSIHFQHCGLLMGYVRSKLTMHSDDSCIEIIKLTQTQAVLVGKLWEEYGPMK